MTFLNQLTRQAAIANAALAVLAACLVNGLIFATGISGKDDAFDRVWFAPPSWLVGSVWVVLYALYGVARWRAASYSAAGAQQSRWIVGLMLWGLAYPLTSAGFNPMYGQLGNAVSLLFALFVYWRIRRTAPPAALWLIPSLLWMGFATFWGIVALTGQ